MNNYKIFQTFRTHLKFHVRCLMTHTFEEKISLTFLERQHQNSQKMAFIIY